VFLGAPYIEALRANQKLSAALAGITAAVVGVIANLGLFFLLHTWFGATDTIHWSVLRVEVPDLPTIAWAAPPLTAVALWLLVRRDWSVLRVLGACGAAGAALHLIAPSALT
jgi:chromate transporter